MVEPEKRSHRRSFRNPPAVSGEYARKADIQAEPEPLYEMWDMVNSDNPFGRPPDLGPVINELAQSGQILDSITGYAETGRLPAEEMILNRYGLEVGDARVFFSGMGSVGTLKQAGALLNPSRRSQLVVIGPSFPFMVNDAITRRDGKAKDRRPTSTLASMNPPTNAHAKMGVEVIDEPLDTPLDDILDQTVRERARRKGIRTLHYISTPDVLGRIATLPAVERYIDTASQKDEYTVIDEANMRWVGDQNSAVPLTKEKKKLVVVSGEVSKWYKLGRLRLGYAVVSNDIADEFQETYKEYPYYLSGFHELMANTLFDPDILDLKGFEEENRRRVQEIKPPMVAAIQDSEMVEVINPNDKSLPFFLAFCNSPYFYEELLRHGLRGTPGSGFAPTHKELDDSFVRFSLVPDAQMIPEFARRMNEAAEAALVRRAKVVTVPDNNLYL